MITIYMGEVSSEQLSGLAAVTLVLGVTYWLVFDRDARLKQ
jgi:uncharacterized membrane protein (DUF373 family)